MVERGANDRFWLDADVYESGTNEPKRFGAWATSVCHLRDLLEEQVGVSRGSRINLFTSRIDPPDDTDEHRLHTFS